MNLPRILPILTVACMLQGSAFAQQRTLDASTNNINRVLGQTWWFDDNNSGNAIGLTQTNGVATVEGNLPGWAWTQFSFLQRNAATNAVEITTKALGNANYASAGPGSVYYDNLAPTTNTTNKTIGWLETGRDFTINSNSTVVVASGGVMFHNNNHYIRSATAGAGNLTSGYSAGGGTNELFLIAAFNSADYRVDSVNIVNNGTTPVAVVVDGVASAQMGLNRPNTYSGGTYVNRGRVMGYQVGAYGTGTVTVRDGDAQAWLRASGTYANNFNLAGIGWIEGAGRLGAVRFNNGARIGGTVTLAGNTRLTPWENTVTGYVEGRITGPFALEKTGAGHLVINNAANDYGATLHTAGGLQVGNAANPNARLGTGPVTVSGSAFLAGFGTVHGPVTLSGTASIEPGWLNEYATLRLASNVTFAAGTVLRADLDNLNRDVLDVTGQLNAGGGTLEARVRGPLNPGRYVIARYGTLTNTFNATVLSNSPRRAFTVDTNTVGEIALVLGSSAVTNLVWKPLANAAWALDAELDWLGNGVTRTPFYSGDDVSFTDAGALTNTVTVTGTLLPGNVTVNSTTNYTFAGTGAITGIARVTKRGPSTLTLTAPSTYTGGTFVEAGTVKLGAAAGLPANGSVTVSPGATFDYNGQGTATTRNYTFTIAGDGVGGAGALVNSGAAIFGNASLAFLNLAANATVGGTNRFDIGTGVTGHVLNGNGFTLTKTGPNEVNLRPQFVTNLASIVVNQGVFKHEGFDRTTPATATTTNIVNNGTILRSYGARTFNYPLVFNGQSQLHTENSAAVWTGAVTLNGTATVNTVVANITLSGAVGGAGTLVKTNANAVILLGNNGYAGGTQVRGGVVQVGANSAAGSVGSGPVSLAAGTVLDYRRTNAVDVANAITGAGSMRHFGTGVARFRSVNLTGSGSLNVGFNALGPATLSVQAGDSISVGRLFTGENPTFTGNIVQTGGSITVTDATDTEGPFRLGHWPTETSTYDLLGGTLTMPVGKISLGIDGHGVWNVNGGTATVVRVDVNGRSSRAGDGGTLNLLAGRLRVGAGGIQSLGTPYVVNYGNGTLEATAPFTSPLNASFSGNTPILTATHTVTLSGVLGGTGGFSKAGPGVLALTGNNSYAGAVSVAEGELRLNGANTGTGTLSVAAGARLAGIGSTAASVSVADDGILAPGNGVGTLAVNGPLALDGNLAFQVSGATADRVTGVTNLTLGPTSAVTLTNTLTAASYVMISYSGTRTGQFGDVTAVTAQGYTVVYDDVAKQVRAEFIPAPAATAFTGNSLVLGWPSRATHTYTVQYRTNLLSGVWIDLPGFTSLPGAAGSMSVTNNVGGDVRGYYRVVNQ